MGLEARLAIQAALILGVLTAGALGYVEIFTKGIDRLPAKVCAGAVDRDVAANILPNTMKAQERGRDSGPYVLGVGSVFHCSVSTRNHRSVLSGESQIGDVSLSELREDYRSARNENTVEVEEGVVSAFSSTEGSSLYVPCTPAGEEAGNARNGYVLIVDARTIGDTRVTGSELQQELIGFGYQLLKHSYKVQGCQGGPELPAELPRSE